MCVFKVFCNSLHAFVTSSDCAFSVFINSSNDIVDSAVALQIRDSINLQQETLKMLLSTLCDLAERERDTVMLGRTHGQAAVPITFGLKVAVWVDEFRRHLDITFFWWNYINNKFSI